MVASVAPIACYHFQNMLYNILKINNYVYW